MMTENINCYFSDSSDDDDDEMLPSLQDIISGGKRDKRYSDSLPTRSLEKDSLQSMEKMNWYAMSSSSSSFTSQIQTNSKSRQSHDFSDSDPFAQKKKKRREKIIIEKILNGAAEQELDRWRKISNQPGFNPIRNKIKMLEDIESDIELSSSDDKELNLADIEFDIQPSSDEEEDPDFYDKNLRKTAGIDVANKKKILEDIPSDSPVSSDDDEELNLSDNESDIQFSSSDNEQSSSYYQKLQRNAQTSSETQNKFVSHARVYKPCSDEMICDDDSDDGLNLAFGNYMENKLKRSSDHDDEKHFSNNKRMKSHNQSESVKSGKTNDDSHHHDSNNNNMQIQLYQSKNNPQMGKKDTEFKCISLSNSDNDDDYQSDNDMHNEQSSGDQESKDEEETKGNDGRMVVLPAPPKTTRFNAKTSNTMELVPYMPYSNFVPRSTREQQLSNESDGEDGYEVVDDDDDDNGGRVVLVGGGGGDARNGDNTEYNQGSQTRKGKFRRAPYQFTYSQIEELEAYFLSNPFCPKGRKNELGSKLRLIPDAVLTWFSNARKRIRKRLERVYRNKNGLIPKNSPDHIGHVLMVDWDNPHRGNAPWVLVSNDYDERRRIDRLLSFNWANFWT